MLRRAGPATSSFILHPSSFIRRHVRDPYRRPPEFVAGGRRPPQQPAGSRRYGPSMKVLRRLYRHLTRYKGWAVVAFGSMLIFAATQTMMMALVRPLFDVVLSSP